MEQIREKIIEHDHALDKVVTAIEHLAANSKETNVKLEGISKSMGKQEIILERISNMDEKYSLSISRIHKRLDEQNSVIKDMGDSRETTGCPALQKSRIEGEILKDKVDKLEDNNKWLVRTVIGKVIVVAIGAIFLLKGGN